MHNDLFGVLQRSCRFRSLTSSTKQNLALYSYPLAKAEAVTSLSLCHSSKQFPPPEPLVQSGLLVINKPAGISSRDCVNHVQRAIGNKRFKVGHCGTLDPLATGVLLVALGEATRLVEQFHDLDKRYQAQFEFNRSSDTLDRDGEITSHDSLPVPTSEQLINACKKWIGPSVLQRPPRYSAIKIQGQRAYDMARRGDEFEPEARPVAIHSLDISEVKFPLWTLDIHCGSGTYVRSIGRDVAADCGQMTIMNELVRTSIGPFTLHDAHHLDDLRSPADVSSRLRSPIEGLPDWHRATVDAEQVTALRHGQKITLHVNQFSPEQAGDRWLAIDEQGQLVALLEVHPSGYARPARVFQTTMPTSQPIATSAKHNPES